MKRLFLFLLVAVMATSTLFAQGSWTALASFGLSTLQARSAHYLPSGVIWVAGGDVPYTGLNYVQVSTDHGATWTKRTVYTNAGLSSLGICNVSALDANTAIVGLTTGEILRTSDGGVRWDTVSQSYDANLGFMDGIGFISSTVAVAFGDADALGTYVARSTDAGLTWTRATNLPDSSKRAEWFAGYATYAQAMAVSGNTIWLSQYYGSGKRPWLLKSTDAGATWTDFPIVLPGGEAQDYYLRSINFKDQNIGFGVIRQVTSSSTTANYLVKTTDGGATWSDTISVEVGQPQNNKRVTGAKWVPGTSTVIATGWSTTGTTSKAWISTDDGSTWTSMNPPSTAGSDLKNSSFIAANRGIVVGYQNVALYQPTTDVEDGVTPSTFALAQNYPNPFNPSTTIQYSLVRSGQVELTVFDVLGRTVATLVNSEKAAGTHSVSFEATDIPSGVYYYTLRSGGFSATKSLVVLK